MLTIEQMAPHARPPVVPVHDLPPVQSCLFGHSRAEVVYDCL